MDSEAKLFEYAADIAKDGKEHTINMLSEKCMPASWNCEDQTRKMYV